MATASRFARVLTLGLMLCLLLALATTALGQPLPLPVTLSWDAPSDDPIPVVGYEVSRQAMARVPGAVVCRVPVSVRTCTDQVPMPGRYAYAVVADYGPAGLSGRSNVIVVTVQSPAPAMPPTALRVALAAPPGPYPLRPVGSLTVQAVDSEELVGEHGAAQNAIDGLRTTFWHTAWSQQTPPLPHTLTLDLRTPCWVDGLAYTPRQDGEVNGTIVAYTLAVSLDAATWITVVSAGTWPATLADKTVRFAPTRGQYVRLTATAEIKGQAYTSAAEVGIFAVAAE